MLYNATENGICSSRSEEIYIAPRQVFPWYMRNLPPSILSRRYWRGGSPLLVNQDDWRLWALSDMMYTVKLENGGNPSSKIWHELRSPDSALGRELDHIVWDYLVETEKYPAMILRLESAREHEWLMKIKGDLYGFARECLQALVAKIDAYDREVLPKQARQEAIAEEIRQGEIRQLVSNAQMLHDDATVCRPAKSIATR